MFEAFGEPESIQSQGMLSDNETIYARKLDCVALNIVCFNTIPSASQQLPERNKPTFG